VRLTISNPGTSSVRVGSLALDSGEGVEGFEVDPAHSDCDEGDLGFTTQTNGGSGWTVPASGSTSVTLAGSLTMAVDASDDCQGATFTVYLRAVG
jgi:hypothetical protein